MRVGLIPYAVQEKGPPRAENPHRVRCCMEADAYAFEKIDPSRV